MIQSIQSTNTQKTPTMGKRKVASTRWIKVVSSQPAYRDIGQAALNFATDRSSWHSKVNVAHFLQSGSRGARGVRERLHCRGCARAVAIVVAYCGMAGAGWTQQLASLPMAPSAVLALGQREVAAAFPQAAQPQARFGGATVEQAAAGPLALGLDDAIDRGVKNNLQVLLAAQTEQSVKGQILAAVYALLPNVKATAYTNALEINLAAMGFKPSSLAAFGLAPGSFKEIVKVDTTDVQVSLDQTLFNLPDFYLYTAARKGTQVAALNTLNARGGVVQAVGTQYLAALADEAQIANAQALEQADEELLRQATLSHDAGVGTNLDVLRAQVEMQNEQQAVVNAENTFAKDKIALNRLIGLQADQELTLTDTVPFAEFAELPLDQVKALAYTRRKDLLALESQVEVAERARKAIRYERVPQLGINGYYGVLGETHGLYHGVFTAQGTLKIPIFEEGRFRGEREVAESQLIALHQEVDALKVTIDAQIRASRLDVESAEELVKVARSNVDLATQALSDTRDRFAAGVDDNLPVIQAQATLADAQSRLVGTKFQYNQAKLALARNTGVVETQYKVYLGR
jgi:outer membrane protein TolC